MFANAKKLSAPKTAAKKNDRVEVEVDGLQTYAALDVVIKSLTTLQKTVGDGIKAFNQNWFAEKGAETKVRPANFRGIDGIASASCELRARSSNSPLNDEEVALLESYKIPVQTIDTVVDTFVINPEYLADAKLMLTVEAALKKVKGIPEDFILKQEGVSKKVLGETAIDEVFKKPLDVINELIGVVTVNSLKPKLDTGDDESIKDAFKIVQKVLDL